MTGQHAELGATKEEQVFSLEGAWSYKVTVLADMVARRVAAVVQEKSALNLSQWRVLAAVADQPGRTSSEVVEITPMDKVLVSRAVRALVDHGLLRREASQEDGRRSHLQLTDEGVRVYHGIVAALNETGASGVGCGSFAQQSDFNRQLDDMIQTYRRVSLCPRPEGRE